MANQRSTRGVRLCVAVSMVALAAACGSDDTSDAPKSALVATSAVPPDAVAYSGFDKDASGWTVQGDSDATSVKPDFDGRGGNPGGLITAKDEVTGGTWYFVAPSRYLGDASSAAGKSLRWDVLTTDASSPYEAFDVMLEGGGKVLVTSQPKDPKAGAWTTRSVLLDTGAWRIAPDAEVNPEIDVSDLPEATRADIETVLADLSGLRIRGEFNDGPDTGSLDNVVLGQETSGG